MFIFPRYALVAAASDTISITAAVNASPSDVEVSLTQDKTTSLSQEDEIVYTITYRSFLSQAIAFTLEANWDNGTIDGATNASVEGLDYVVGSAGNAYGNTPAVISTLHSKISWNISHLSSSQGGQSVSFALRLNDNYRNTLPVTFPVHARITVPVITSDATVTTKYLYKAPLPTPSPLASPTPTSTPATTTLPSPTVTPKASTTLSTIKRSLEIHEINPAGATIQYQGLSRGSVTVRYGKSPTGINQKLSVLSESNTFLVRLTNLTEGTDYYAQVSEDSSDFTSDIYQFHTSTQKAFTEIFESSSLVMNTQGVMLYNGSHANAASTKSEYPSMSTSIDNALDMSIAVKNPELIRSIQIFIRDPLVLGVSSDELLQTGQGKLTAVTDKLFTGRLRAPSRPGKYEVISRIEDIYGNIVEQKIADFFAMPPLIIQNSRTKRPIENASVQFSLFDPHTKLYTLIPNTATSVQNPAYSDINGHVPLHLSPGTYRLLIQSIGYADQTIEILIDPTTIPQIPTVSLTPLPFSLGMLVQKQKQALLPFIPLFTQFVLSLTKSQEIFTILFLGSFLFTLGCICYGISLRFQVRIKDIPGVFKLFLTNMKQNRHEFVTIQGVLRLPNGTACMGGTICIQMTGSVHPTFCTKTNHRGEFLFRNVPIATTYQLLILDTQEVEIYRETIQSDTVSAPITITLRQAPSSKRTLILVLLRITLQMVGNFTLEMFLFLSTCCAIISWFVYAPAFAIASTLIVIIAHLAWVIDLYFSRQFSVRNIVQLK